MMIIPTIQKWMICNFKSHDSVEFFSDNSNYFAFQVSRILQKFSIRTPTRSKSAERICNKATASAAMTPVFKKSPSIPVVQAAAVEVPDVFLGRAVALVDCIPTPYDKEALNFRKGDVIDVISMDLNGLWKGHINGRVGLFKFISVQMLKDHHDQKIRKRRKSEIFEVVDDDLNSRPKSVKDLLKRIHLEVRMMILDELQLVIIYILFHSFQHLTSLFVLNGFDDLETFREITEQDLDSLNIQDPEQRSTIMTAVELLQEYTSCKTLL